MTRPALGFRVLDEDDDLVIEFPELEGFTHISGFRTGRPGTAFSYLQSWLTTQARVSLIAFAESGDHNRLIAGYKRCGFVQHSPYSKHLLTWIKP